VLGAIEAEAVFTSIGDDLGDWVAVVEMADTMEEMLRQSEGAGLDGNVVPEHDEDVAGWV
jgi:hypothetical protein